MLDNLLRKTKYGVLIDLTKYIQIPILQYSRGYNINENPYIKLENIHSEYELVKGKTEEIDYWEKVKFMFEQGKVSGYEDKEVYPISKKQAIVEANKNHATFYFWGPDVALDDDEEEWLQENTEEQEVYIDGNPTSFYIYIRDIIRDINKIID